eukprot:XP_003727113.1 PREDICTED: uncharacterized protein LOC100888993 [Strongylocentrotus purpuratus]
MPISSTTSPPNTARLQYRIKRSQLRLVQAGKNEQTSDSNSSHDVSVRSSRVAMSSDASSVSITCSGKQSSVAQPRLLSRRWSRCGTPVPREDPDQLSDNVDNGNIVDNNNAKEDTLNSRYRVDSFVNEPGVDLLHQRLPSIEQRPVSRHVVYSVQYDVKTKTSTTKPVTVSSSFDSPRTLRQKALQMDFNQTTRLSRPDKEINVEFARRATFPNDDFVDELTKNRILTWLENVETALEEDSVDSTILTSIQEESL